MTDLEVLGKLWDERYEDMRFDDTVKANCLSAVSQSVDLTSVSMSTICSIMDAVSHTYVLGFCEGYYSTKGR